MRLVKPLNVPKGVPVITGDDVDKTKPSPDAFVLAAQHLGVSIEESIVVGDSVWDLLAAVRKRALGVGVLSGGSGYEDTPAERPLPAPPLHKVPLQKPRF